MIDARCEQDVEHPERDHRHVREAEEANAKREALAKENDALKAAAATGSGAGWTPPARVTASSVTSTATDE